MIDRHPGLLLLVVGTAPSPGLAGWPAAQPGLAALHQVGVSDPCTVWLGGGPGGPGHPPEVVLVLVLVPVPPWYRTTSPLLSHHQAGPSLLLLVLHAPSPSSLNSQNGRDRHDNLEGFLVVQ